MTVAPARLAAAHRLTIAVIALAAFAAGIGLFMPQVYRDTAWVVPQNRAQDLVTLLALVVLIPVLMAARRGSPGSTLVWLGLLGYLAYTYTGAAFAYAFNLLFPVYVALFALSGAALIAALTGIDAQALHAAFDAKAPRRAVLVFLLSMALILCLLWFSQIVPFYTEGRLPEMIELAKVPTVFVYVLDLGVVVPLALLAAWWLWRGQAWGSVLAAFVLVKATTMGLALLWMTVFALRAGLQVDPVLSIAWVSLAAVGLGMSIWFFRHCRGLATPATQAATPSFAARPKAGR
jgi:hypothetical protein